MGRAEVLQGVRQMRFEGLLERHERGELSQEEAAEMLGVSERTFRRWRDRLRDEGPEGLRDRRIGKPSSRRAAVEEILRMLGLYEERYEGFTVKHFHEQLLKRHDYKLGYTVTRLALQGAGLVRPAPRRSAHRKKRPRRPSAIAAAILVVEAGVTSSASDCSISSNRSNRSRASRSSLLTKVMIATSRSRQTSMLRRWQHLS